MSETVVLLHGFGGTGRHWDRVVALTDRERYSPLAIELTDADPLTVAGAVDLVARSAPERFVLCGYSMGGRVALHVAAALGDRVSRLVLISTSAGIEGRAEQAARRATDEALASEIEQGTIDDFIIRWQAVPLFDGDPTWVRDAIAEDERRVAPSQLAATLRAFGAGTMEPLWDCLAAITMPTAVLAGERDIAYRAISERLVATLPNATLDVIAGAGHRVALEAPSAVLAAFGAAAPR